MTSPHRTHARRGAKAAATGLLVGLAAVCLSAAQAGATESVFSFDLAQMAQTLRAQVVDALVRLPLAAALGAVLALRPRRRGTPLRQPAVVQTQVILAMVGALIMLVVGSSLARAFGIVGAANLIRYRSKVDDPKDAVVMLCTLSLGLGAGVGLYGLAVTGAVLLFVALWVIEGLEPQTRVFGLSIRLGRQTEGMRPRIEAALQKFGVAFELRGEADEEVSYMVTMPSQLHTDQVSGALTALVPSGTGEVVWKARAKNESAI